MRSHLFVCTFFALCHGYIPRNDVALPSSALSAVIRPGDRVLVVGGTGGVGQLISKKLQTLGDYPVRVTSRSQERAEEGIVEGVEVAQLDLVKGNDEQLQEALDGVNAIVISVGTTAFPTLKWKDGNTPQAVDDVAVSRLATAASNLSSLKKIVHLTSVGVDRTDEMPFKILNLFGVLDAKKRGEDAVKSSVAGTNADYAIVRPGRLVGGPFTNLDLAKLLKIEGGAENGVDVASGDALLGDCKRDACAEAIVQCLTNEAGSNVEFSIVSNEAKALTTSQWTEAFKSL